MATNKKTDGELFKEFMFNWNTQNKDGLISFEEFAEYFEVKIRSITKDSIFVVYKMQSRWLPIIKK